jgi:hypothetical protein
MQAACETGATRLRAILGSRYVSSSTQKSTSPASVKDAEVDCRCAGEDGMRSETPVLIQKSKQLPGGSENADDLGSVNLMPKKLVNTEFVGVMGTDSTMEFT